MDDLERFVTQVESYLSDSGLTPTAFGRDAANDPNFVFDLRAGRQPRRDTVRKVRSYMLTTNQVAAE